MTPSQHKVVSRLHKQAEIISKYMKELDNRRVHHATDFELQKINTKFQGMLVIAMELDINVEEFQWTYAISQPRRENTFTHHKPKSSGKEVLYSARPQ
jgi:hypothetical protein